MPKPADTLAGPRQTRRSEVVIATFDPPATVDPHVAFDSGSRHIVLNVYESLLRYDPGAGSFRPWLASAIERSADGRSYRLAIRRGVVDHSGTEISVRDALYSIRRSVVSAEGLGSVWLGALLGQERNDPREPGNLAAACECIQADGDALVFSLQSPFPAFPAVIAQWGLILSQDWAVQSGAWDGSASTLSVRPRPAALSEANGTGPFMLDQFTPGADDEIVLRRNDRYWRSRASAEKISLSFIPDRIQRECALTEGRADFAVCQPESLARVRQSEGIVLEETSAEWMVNPLGFFGFKLAADSPSLATFPQQGMADLSLRRALALAFDYDAFVSKALDGESIVHPGPFPRPSLPSGPEPPFCYDLDAARRELARAWDGTAMRDGFELPIYTHRDNYAREVAAEILCEGVNRLSPRCKAAVVALPFEELLDYVYSGRCPVAWLGWDADYVHPHAFAQELLASTGFIPRRTGVHLPGADELLRRALSTPEDEQREPIYIELAAAAIANQTYLYVPGKLSLLTYDGRWRGVRLFPGAANVLDFCSFEPRPAR